MKDVMLWAGAGQIGMAIARRMGAGMKIVVGDKKLATTPTEELLSLDFLQPENIRDTLHAYQMAKRCNEKRVTAQAVEWGKRGARLNDIAPASSSLRRHSTSSTARAATSTRTCSLSAPRDAPARRAKSQTSPSF